jgi:hypothetical protein
MPRLGAEFYNPDDPESLPVQHCRLAFLARIESVAPEVLQSLHDDVLPAYVAWAAATPDRNFRWSTIQGFASTLNSRPPEVVTHALAQLGGADPRPLVGAMQAWASRYNLLDEWMVDDALETVRRWAMYPPSRLQWGADGWPVIEPDFPSLTLTWEAGSMTWAAFERYAHEALRRYRTEVNAVAAGYGLPRSPEMNAPRRTNDPGLHFEWLVRYQVQGWTHEAIAKHYRRSWDPVKRTSPSVASALRKTAKLIGLTPR